MPRLFKQLSTYIIIAIICGVLLGQFYPTTAIKMEILGKSFIEIIKKFIYPIIFLTISMGIGNMGSLKKVGRIGFKALLYFEIVSTFSLLLGILVAYIFKPGNISTTTLKLEKIPTKYSNATLNWVDVIAHNLTIQVLIYAIIFGIILNYVSNKKKIILFLEQATSIVFKLLNYVMYLAPIGAFGGISFIVGKFGFKSFIPLFQLISCVYITMAIFIFCILGLILKYYKLSIIKYLRLIKNEILVVFGTSSSESALPNMIRKLESVGCSKSVVGLVIPTGYSFNLDGTSIYLSMAIIFIAQLYHIELSFAHLLYILLVLMITSKGAAGVAGSGFVVLASTLSIIQTIPVEGLAFLLGIDKFMSEARSITNLIGNGVATLVISKSEGENVVL